MSMRRVWAFAAVIVITAGNEPAMCQEPDGSGLAQQPQRTESASFHGTWNGELIQEGFASLKISIRIDRFVVGKVSGSVKHPDPTNAEGVVIGIAHEGAMMRVFESITSGRERCRDGMAELRLVDADTIERVWIDPVTGQKGAGGKLKREKAETSEPSSTPNPEQVAPNPERTIVAKPVVKEKVVFDPKIDPETAPAVAVLIDPDKGRQSKVSAFQELIWKKAVPEEYVRIMSDFVRTLPPRDYDRKWMIHSLHQVGKAAVPSLMEWVRSDNPQESRTAIEALGKIGFDAAAATSLLISVAEDDLDSISRMYSNSSQRDQDWERFRCRITAIGNFRNIGIPPDLAVPVLRKLTNYPRFDERQRNGYVNAGRLDDKWVRLVCDSVTELGKYGPQAAPALNDVGKLMITIQTEASSSGRKSIDYRTVEIMQQCVRTIGAIGPAGAVFLPVFRQWLANPGMSRTIGESSLEEAIQGITTKPANDTNAN